MHFELWEGSDPERGGEEWTLLGLDHDKSRQMLEPWMRLTSTVEADNHDEAMQLAYDRNEGVTSHGTNVQKSAPCEDRRDQPEYRVRVGNCPTHSANGDTCSTSLFLEYLAETVQLAPVLTEDLAA
jgi:hypothetical protein